MSCLTGGEETLSLTRLCAFVLLSEGTSETQTGGTPPSGHQGKALALI